MSSPTEYFIGGKMEVMINPDTEGNKNYVLVTKEHSAQEIWNFAEKNNAIYNDRAMIAMGDATPCFYTRKQLEMVLAGGIC